jgi:Putative Flp pilus-assembly TadE/G-like
MSTTQRRSTRGQTLVLFSLSLVGIILFAGLVIDGGYALSQRRGAQNAADFAAIAGTRVVGASLTGDSNATDPNVLAAVEAVLAANGARISDSNGKLYTAQYVDKAGAVVGGLVGSGSIPPSAQGVVVNASKAWRPYFLGVIGITDWSAGATAVAVTPALNVGNGTLPFGISLATLAAHAACPDGSTAETCGTFHLTPGSLNIPGGFAWLKMGCYPNKGADNKLFGLGQIPPASNGGCSNSKPFLDTEWGALPTTLGNTFGCCTSVIASTAAGYGNYIGSLPGNKASVNDSSTTIAYYEANDIAGWVPVWDYANGNGSNGYYHIVGYAAIEFIHVKGSKDIEGVIRIKDCPGTGNDAPPVGGVAAGCAAPDLNLTAAFNGVVQLTR